VLFYRQLSRPADLYPQVDGWVFLKKVALKKVDGEPDPKGS
jgi:hypothetical protein